MVALTRAQRKEIVAYVLGIFGVEDEDIENIVETLKLDSVLKLRGMTTELLREMNEKEKITYGDVAAIQGLKAWMSNSKTIPENLEDWKRELTYDSLYKYGDKAGTQPQAKEEQVGNDNQSDISSSTKSKNSSGGMEIKLEDYPEFNGQHTEWYTYRERLEGIADVHGLTEVLCVEDKEEHLKRRSEEKEYDDNVKMLYSILQAKTASGTALAKVKIYKPTKDGALAWLHMKNYYDQEGNKSLYGAKCLNEILGLRLEKSSQGGFDKYLSDFETLCTKLEEAGQGLKEDQKRTFFLSGIKDEDYDATIQICQDVDYGMAILKLRHKSVLLGRQSGPDRRKQNKANRQKEGKKLPGDASLERDSDLDNSDTEDVTSGEYLRPEVWEKMSWANKQLWIEGRDLRKAKNSDKNGRETETHKTRAKKHESDEEASENEEEERKKTLWKPPRRVAIMKTVTPRGMIKQPVRNVGLCARKGENLSPIYNRLPVLKRDYGTPKNWESDSG